MAVLVVGFYLVLALGLVLGDVPSLERVNEQYHFITSKGNVESSYFVVSPGEIIAVRASEQNGKTTGLDKEKKEETKYEFRAQLIGRQTDDLITDDKDWILLTVPQGSEYAVDAKVAVGAMNTILKSAFDKGQTIAMLRLSNKEKNDVSGKTITIRWIEGWVWNKHKMEQMAKSAHYDYVDEYSYNYNDYQLQYDDLDSDYGDYDDFDMSFLRGYLNGLHDAGVSENSMLRKKYRNSYYY